MSRTRTTNAPPDFDSLARVYRWMEWASFGPWLQYCRCTFLPSLVDCRKALILGDGDGRFTARLLRTNAQVQIDAVDASSAMLKALIRRAGKNGSRVHTQCADVRDWQPSGEGYDLIVSHFFLDCLTAEEIVKLAETLRRVSLPSAVWIISEFAIPPNAFGRWLARPLVAGLYRAFGVFTGLDIRRLPDHRTALCNAGFALRAKRHHLGGLLVSELWASLSPEH
jgi:ubiquinone/menaquinone biosynthesis C-methylase UbiE